MNKRQPIEIVYYQESGHLPFTIVPCLVEINHNGEIEHKYERETPEWVKVEDEL